VSSVLVDSNVLLDVATSTPTAPPDGPVNVLALTSLEGVGPKTVRALHGQLGVRTLEGLRRAGQEGRARGVTRFGAKREARLLAAFKAGEETAGRRLLGELLPVAARLVSPLRAVPR